LIERVPTSVPRPCLHCKKHTINVCDTCLFAPYCNKKCKSEDRAEHENVLRVIKSGDGLRILHIINGASSECKKNR